MSLDEVHPDGLLQGTTSPPDVVAKAHPTNVGPAEETEGIPPCPLDLLHVMVPHQYDPAQARSGRI